MAKPVKTIECGGYIISAHCQEAMNLRDIPFEDILLTVTYGEIIAKYDTDKPFPSKLMLKFVEGRALHVVVAQHPVSLECILITAYWPDRNIWQKDFKNKK